MAYYVSGKEVVYKNKGTRSFKEVNIKREQFGRAFKLIQPLYQFKSKNNSIYLFEGERALYSLFDSE